MKRNLGLAVVLAVVMGDMIGSGIFFTPGQLAVVAQYNWPVYFFWALCGAITLCGALTLAEISTWPGCPDNWRTIFGRSNRQANQRIF